MCQIEMKLIEKKSYITVIKNKTNNEMLNKNTNITFISHFDINGLHAAVQHSRGENKRMSFELI